MFNIGTGEMMLVAVALLIAVGPDQLPGLVRRVGQAVGQFRSVSDRLRADFTAGLEELDRAADVKSWTDLPSFDVADTATDFATSPRPVPTKPSDPADGASDGDSDSDSEGDGEHDSEDHDVHDSGTAVDSADHDVHDGEDQSKAPDA